MTDAERIAGLEAQARYMAGQISGLQSLIAHMVEEMRRTDPEGAGRLEMLGRPTVLSAKAGDPHAEGEEHVMKSVLFSHLPLKPSSAA